METLIVSGQIPPAQFRFNRRVSPVRRAQSLRFSRRIAAASNLPSQTTEPEPKSPNRMFFLKLGFVGEFFAAELKNKGWEMSLSCGNSSRKRQLEEDGFGDVHIFDGNGPESSALDAMKGCTHLLVSASAAIEHEEVLRNKLMGGDLKWLCYLSSTRVYGDHGGAWVDEDSATNPETESAKKRLAEEERWLNLAHGLGLSAFVFRLGHVYGPGRSAIQRIMNKGDFTPSQMMELSKKYVPRIHVDDVCQALEASIVKPSDRNVYNIVDDDPAPLDEVLPFTQELVHKRWPGRMRPPLPYVEEISTRGGARVSNVRMKNELGVSLRYPSYVSGLQSIIDQMTGSYDDYTLY